MNPGDNIVRSGALIETVWMQVHDLANSLAALTESALADRMLGNLRQAGATRFFPEWGESGFNATSYAVCCPVTRKKSGDGVPTAWINYQISVHGTGIPNRAIGDVGDLGPVLHVSFWRTPTDFSSQDSYVSFPTLWEVWDIKDHRLLFWDAERIHDAPQWTFSIRLLELDSEDTLQRSVIAPVVALIGGSKAIAALPGTLPGLVFYSNVDLGESGRDMVAHTALPKTVL